MGIFLPFWLLLITLSKLLHVICLFSLHGLSRNNACFWFLEIISWSYNYLFRDISLINELKLAVYFHTIEFAHIKGTYHRRALPTAQNENKLISIVICYVTPSRNSLSVRCHHRRRPNTIQLAFLLFPKFTNGRAGPRVRYPKAKLRPHADQQQPRKHSRLYAIRDSEFPGKTEYLTENASHPLSTVLKMPNGSLIAMKNWCLYLLIGVWQGVSPNY